MSENDVGSFCLVFFMMGGGTKSVTCAGEGTHVQNYLRVPVAIGVVLSVVGGGHI